MQLTSEVERYVALRRSLGCSFVDNERMLQSYARFAADRGDEWIRSNAVIDWGVPSTVAGTILCQAACRSRFRGRAAR